MGGIIRSLSSVIKTSGSPKGLGNEKKTAHSSSLPSSEQCSCGTVTSEVPTTWPGLVWELPTTQRPGQLQMWLCGGRVVGGSCLWCFAVFLSESAQSKFFWRCFSECFTKKVGGVKWKGKCRAQFRSWYRLWQFLVMWWIGGHGSCFPQDGRRHCFFLVRLSQDPSSKA